jgi:hypothetical protein
MRQYLRLGITSGTFDILGGLEDLSSREGMLSRWRFTRLTSNRCTVAHVILCKLQGHTNVRLGSNGPLQLNSCFTPVDIATTPKTLVSDSSPRLDLSYSSSLYDAQWVGGDRRGWRFIAFLDDRDLQVSQRPPILTSQLRPMPMPVPLPQS